jgi:hypothetical protein
MGSLKLWKTGAHYYETLGFHGVLGLVFAIGFIRTNTLMSVLTLVPCLLLLFSPSVIFIIRGFGEAQPYYRVLYAMPTSLMVVYGLRRIFAFCGKGNLFLSGLAVLCLAYSPKAPWRGRLVHLLHKPPLALAFAHLEATAISLKKHFPNVHACEFVTDDATDFVVGSHLGLKRRGSRLATVFYESSLKNWDKMPERVNSPSFCGILVSNKFQLFPGSKLVRFLTIGMPITRTILPS